MSLHYVTKEPRSEDCGWLGNGGSLTPLGGSSSAVERQLPKLDVAGSIPVSRSKFSSAFSLHFLDFFRNVETAAAGFAHEGVSGNGHFQGHGADRNFTFGHHGGDDRKMPTGGALHG